MKKAMIALLTCLAGLPIRALTPPDYDGRGNFSPAVPPGQPTSLQGLEELENKWHAEEKQRGQLHALMFYNEGLLIRVAEDGMLDAVKYLVLNREVNVNGRGRKRFHDGTTGPEYPFSALDVAVGGRHAEVADFLIQHHADVNDWDEVSGQTPLYQAAENYDLPILRLLIAAKADADLCAARVGAKGCTTPLMAAAGSCDIPRIDSPGDSNGAAETVDLLLRAGAKKDLKDAFGDTALAIVNRTIKGGVDAYPPHNGQEAEERELLKNCYKVRRLLQQD